MERAEKLKLEQLRSRAKAIKLHESVNEKALVREFYELFPGQPRPKGGQEEQLTTVKMYLLLMPITEIDLKAIFAHRAANLDQALFDCGRLLDQA